METPVKPEKKRKKRGKKEGGTKKPPKPASKKVKALTKKAGKKVTPKKTSPGTKKPKTAFETVVGIVRRSRKRRYSCHDQGKNRVWRNPGQKHHLPGQATGKDQEQGKGGLYICLTPGNFGQMNAIRDARSMAPLGLAQK